MVSTKGSLPGRKPQRILPEFSTSSSDQRAKWDRQANVNQNDTSSNGLFAVAALVPALLASSCCIPQLLMTLTMGFGCLGFAALTPFRPLFLSLTAIASVAAIQNRGLRWRTVLLLMVTAFTAFSDVIIREYNEGDIQRAVSQTRVFGQRFPAWLPAVFAPPRWVPRAQLLLKPPSRPYPYSPPTATREQLADSDPAMTPPQQARVTLTAPTIGCDACAARVRSGLVTKFGKHISSIEVRQKTKVVVINLNNQAAVNDQALMAAMAELESPAASVVRQVL